VELPAWRQILGLGPGARVFVSSLLMIAAILAGGMVVMLLRRRYHPSRQEERAPGLSMKTIEDLRRDGQISEEEFQRLRDVALGVRSGRAKPPISTSSGPTESDDDESTRPDKG